MYIVKSDFCDLKDKKHVYEAGDKYPRPGVKIDKARVAELMGDANAMGRPLIAEVVEPKKRTRKNAD